MPTTTNYGWTTPADTDLVKDGASAIRTLGNSIDSTLKTQIDAQIPDSLLTTKGDIIAATAASTPARLGVGTNGQVLTADSTASSGVKWADVSANSMTLLSTTTLSGSSVSITSISQAYKDLRIEILSPVRAATGYFTYLFNNNTGTVYDYIWFQEASAVVNTKNSQSNINGIGYVRTPDSNVQFIFEIKNYADATMKKPWTFHGSDSEYFNWAYGSFDSTSAVDRFDVSANGSTFSSGTVKIYGVK